MTDAFFTVSDQTLIFFEACLLGSFLGVVYDFFRAMRMIFPHNSIAVAIEDVLFVLFSSLCLFVFSAILVYNSVRLFCIIGMMIGFFIYLMTVGKLVMSVLSFLLKCVKDVGMFVYRKIFKKPVEFFDKKLLKFRKKKKIEENPLKDEEELVYN